MRGAYSRIDVFEMRTASRLVKAMERGNRRWPWLGRTVGVAVVVAVVVASPLESAIEALQARAEEDEAKAAGGS
jgi:hypothetical protein